MSWLSRRRARADGDAAPASPAESAPVPLAPDPPVDDGGPWDISQVTSRGTRLDLGALWIPVAEDLTVRLEWDKKSGRVIAASIARDGSTLRVQVFAAPKTAGIWDEIRPELAESIIKGGGSAEDAAGPFGPELRAKLPVKTRDGRTGKRAVRYVGVDGPRWFIRAEFHGKAATNPDAAEPLESVLRDVVVDRGTEAHPPRELLPLTPPGAATQPPAEDGRKPPEMPGRGPEIAEIR